MCLGMTPTMLLNFLFPKSITFLVCPSSTLTQSKVLVCPVLQGVSQGSLAPSGSTRLPLLRCFLTSFQLRV